MKHHIKLPLNAHHNYIFDADGQMFAEIRGYGHLQYSEEDPNQIQKERAEYIVECCNAPDNTLNQVIEQLKAMMKNLGLPDLDSDHHSMVSFIQRHVLESLVKRFENVFGIKIEIE